MFRWLTFDLKLVHPIYTLKIFPVINLNHQIRDLFRINFNNIKVDSSMKKFLKIFGIAVVVLLILLTAGFIYFNSVYPNVEPAKDIKVELTKARIERGKYLANHVTMCMDCHSERDWTKFSGPVKEGTEGKGGELIDEKFGIPGKLYVRNITPAAIGNWSDGEIIRALTCGVNNKGEALFPMMPYFNLSNLSEEDVLSIVAYIRTLKPIENNVPDKELNFPVNYIEKTLPLKNYTPKESISKSDKINYGKYLLTIASCEDCHTPAVEGEPDMEKRLAGGAEINLPWGIIRPANITPDKETGIGNWSKDDFIAKFKYYDSDSTRNILVGQGEFNSIMPWSLYAGMTDEDLGAIYEYLQSITPVKNLVTKWTPQQKQLAKK